MSDRISRRALNAGLLGTAIATAAGAQTPARRAARKPVRYDTSNGEWRTYGGDQKSLRYSALDQVHAGNFNRLEPAWSYAEPDDTNNQSTPLMVNGVIYHTAGLKRAVLALDARTGKQIWRFDFDEGRRGNLAPRPGSGHGVSYWTDGSRERILYVTIGYQLICLDAKTGKPDTSFGVNGVVDLKKDDDQEINLDGEGAGQEIGLHSTPLVVGDVIVVGAAHSASVTIAKHVKGYVRGFDIRTGKRLWIFHTVPKKGEEGYDTWLEGSAETAGNTGNWAQNSADPELGLVYLAIEQPTDDYYGAFRKGNNLFSDCLVAVDAKTGKRRWYYQTVHHDIWDRDLMCAPILFDATINGRKVKALAQPTKHAFTFVLDRTNGKPIWPIPEVPVPVGDVPGEYYSPTQPIPSKPPPFDVQGVPISQLIDFTPELRQEALQVLKNYNWGHLFAPPIVSKWPDKLATIQSPSTDGAAQWPGGALDPETNVMYIFSNHAYTLRGLLPGDVERTGLAHVWGVATATGSQAAALPPSEQPQTAAAGRGTAARGAAAPAAAGRGGRGAAGAGNGATGLRIQGLPLLKPPYGRLTAIDLNKGEILWQVAHGETPDDVKNHPLLKGKAIPRTGSQGKVGTLVTKTLVIAGDGTQTTGADGRTGAWLRAYDKKTGQEVGAIRMPTRVSGSPMTYALDGRQYIAVPISGPGVPAQLAVYRLPA
jgi:quinoprotein glucose dehydrogenase